MGKERFAKRVYWETMAGSGRRGRLQTSWKDDVKESLMGEGYLSGRDYCWIRTGRCGGKKWLSGQVGCKILSALPIL